MKEFFRKNLEVTIVATLYFTSLIMVYATIAPFIGIKSVPISIIWQMVIIATILTGIHYLIYATEFFCSINKYLRLFIYYLVLLALGYGSAKVFNWFDIGDMKNIIIAISILTVSFIMFVASIGAYNKLAGEQLNEKLKMYKNNKKSE